jgi:hypothetical protein
MRNGMLALYLGVVVSLSGLGAALAAPVSACAACGRTAPAPEIGASFAGLLMAGALAFYYVRSRRRSEQS